jgi:hypothetical protein
VSLRLPRPGPLVICVVGLIGVLGLPACGDSTDTGGVGVTTSPVTTSITTTTRATTTTTFATTTTRGVRYLTLLEALQAGLVEAEFRSTGGASGDIIELAIRLVEASDDILSLTVPSGMMLANPSGGEQDLVIRGLEGLMTGENTYEPTTEIELPDLDWREYLVEAYCAEAHDDNPTEGGVLSADGLADEELIQILEAIEPAGAGDDIMVIQAVIWAVTDDVRMRDLEAIGYGLDETELALARTVIEQAGLDPGAFRLFG